MHYILPTSNKRYYQTIRFLLFFQGCLGSTVSMNLLLCSEEPTLWLLKLSTPSRTAEDQGWWCWELWFSSGVWLARLSIQSLQSLCCLWPLLCLDILKMSAFCRFPLSVSALSLLAAFGAHCKTVPLLESVSTAEITSSHFCFFGICPWIFKLSII